MSIYMHKVNYYETDAMGITHHSNYIRFMEEARMNLLAEIGYPMKKLEAAGIISPVVSLNCEYKHTTTYSDEIKIQIKIIKYSGVRLSFSYELRNTQDDTLVATASSVHCFLDKSGRPVTLKKCMPDLDEVIRNMLDNNVG